MPKMVMKKAETATSANIMTANYKKIDAFFYRLNYNCNGKNVNKGGLEETEGMPYFTASLQPRHEFQRNTIGNWRLNRDVQLPFQHCRKAPWASGLNGETALKLRPYRGIVLFTDDGNVPTWRKLGTPLNAQ